MPNNWLSWRRSLACKLQPGEVHDPQSFNVVESGTSSVHEAAIFMSSSRKVYLRSGCSRSIANLKDVIHSSRRMDSSRVPAMPNFSPKSVESNDFVQSISQEALFRDHGCDHHPHQYKTHHNPLHQNPSQGKLTLEEVVAQHHPHPHHQYHHQHHRCPAGTSGSFYGTPLHPSARIGMAPGTPLHHISQGPKGNTLMKLSGCYDCKNPTISLEAHKAVSGAAALEATSGESVREGEALPPIAPKAICQRCGQPFPKYEALEQHHLLKHAVVELQEGDSSRNVVEIIFRTSWLRPPEPVVVVAGAGSVRPLATGTADSGGQPRIERVLKVNNLPRILARFEDYREGVKMRASKLPKKHPRCLADGNELLRFYGAKLECGLVRPPDASAPASTCSSSSCYVCRIIRFGFPKIRSIGADLGASSKGILTTATSGRAHQLLMAEGAQGQVCDVSPSAATPPSKEVEPFTLPMTTAVGCKVERSDHRGRSHRHNSALFNSQDRPGGGCLMAMLVCRVIAGRVHKSPPSMTAIVASPTPRHTSYGDSGLPCTGFDSVAGGESGIGVMVPAVGLHSRFEELTIFNPRAILPCFVVLYRCTTDRTCKS